MSGEVIAMEKPAQTVATQSTRNIMDLVQHAVMNNGSMEMVEKLLSLQERWEQGQARKAFDAAMAAAKAEIPVIKKNRDGHNKAKYADLAAYAETIPAIIGKHGLSYRYRAKQGNGAATVTCIISHRDGYSEETELSSSYDKSGNKSDIHAVGSTLTYLQRYSLCLALGLASGVDDDGQAASGNETISDQQAQDLINLADEINADKISFCKYMKVASIADIQIKDFDRAKKALESKRRAG